MTILIKHLATAGLAGALALAAGCSRPRTTHLTVQDLMDDRVTRDGVLLKCNRNPGIGDTDIDCHNARVAIERMAAENEHVDAAAREVQFERRREELRLAQDDRRRAQEASRTVDPYSMPVLPVATPDAAPASRNP